MKKYILPILITCSLGALVFLVGVIVSVSKTLDETGDKVISEPTKSDSPNVKLAWIYGADSRTISDHDCKTADRLMEAVGEWNEESADIVRDLLDQNVSAEEFLLTSSRQLPKLSAVLYRMNVNVGLIENRGVRDTLAPTVPIHEEGLMLYRQLHEAVEARDQNKQTEISRKIRLFGERKRAEFMPLVRRIQVVVSASTFDDAMKQFQEEVSKRLRGE